LLVLVSVEKSRYTAHRDVVCSRSEFFKAACTEYWQEGQTRVVSLPDTEPGTFPMYMDLICDRLVYDNVSSSLPLIISYVLGDFLGDIKARNQAMKLLLSPRQANCPSTVFVDFVWKRTTPGSLLRKWAVDMIAAELGPERFATFITRYPAEFVQEIAIKLQEQAYPRLDHPSVSLRSCLEVDVERDV
jgi:hypothetical protein